MRFHEIIKKLFEGVEEKTKTIVANQGPKITQAAKRDAMAKDLEADQIVSKLAEMDPTPNKQYLQWLANNFIAGQFRLEDQARTLSELELFHQVKNRLEKKDINQYRTRAELLDAIEPFMQPDADIRTKGEKEREIKSAGAKPIVNTPDFKVFEILNQEAACYYGSGTKWCTAGKKDNMFDQYHTQGPIYILIANQGGKDRKWQFHVESNQYMDERDTEISKSDIKLLSQYPGYKKFLNMLIDKHYKPYLKYLEPEKNSSGKKSK